MAGYTAIANLEAGASVRGKINTQFDELFGENAKALVSVADAAALAAIPTEYLSVGKLVYQIDIATILEWSGTAWAAQTGPATPTTLDASGNATVGGTLDVTGAATLADVAADNAAFSADATIDGTLDVTGQTTVVDIEATGDIVGVDAILSGDIGADTATIVGLTQAGAGRFGDIAGGDYSEFEADGTYVAAGAATTWKDLILSASNLRPGNSAPTFGAFLGGIYTYRFDAGSAHEVHGAVELQHDYKEGTDLVFHVHWSPSTTNTGNIVWGIEYTVQNPGAVFGATDTQSMTPTPAPGAVAHHALNNVYTISGTGLKIGAIVSFRLFRQNGGTDTFTGNAFLHSVGIHYECDTLGSRTITAKANQ